MVAIKTIQNKTKKMWLRYVYHKKEKENQEADKIHKNE